MSRQHLPIRWAAARAGAGNSTPCPALISNASRAAPWAGPKPRTRDVNPLRQVTLRDDVLAGALPDDAEDEVKNECGCAVSFSEGRRRCKRKVKP